MNQNRLNQCVARATGESVQRIRRMGFGLMVMPTLCRTRPGRQTRGARDANGAACRPSLAIAAAS